MEIEGYLKQAGVKYTKREHPVVFTAQELAATEHVSGDEVAKTVVVRADQRDVLCVLPASYKVDMGKLSKVLGADRCRLAEEAELAKLFPDVELGAEPPFGKPYGLATLVDTHLAGRKKIVFAAGSHRHAIEMDYDDYRRLAEGVEADFSAHL